MNTTQLTAAALETLMVRLAPRGEEITLSQIRAALPGVGVDELDNALLVLRDAGKITIFPRVALL